MAEGQKQKLGKGRHRSALKRKRQNIKRRIRNKARMSSLKTSVKTVRTNPGAQSLKSAQSAIAKAGRTRLIHPRRAARLISRLTKSMNKSSGKK